MSADLTGQANHLGVTIQADIIKQKMPENNGGYNALKFGKTHKRCTSKLTTDHPIDLVPLPGGELLHGPRRPDQFRRRFRRMIWPMQFAPRSSTSAPAAWGLSPAARHSKNPSLKE